LRQLHDYSGSLENLSRAIEIKPDFAQAYLDRSITKSKLGDNDGAVLDLLKAIELEPGLADSDEFTEALRGIRHHGFAFDRYIQMFEYYVEKLDTAYLKGIEGEIR